MATDETKSNAEGKSLVDFAHIPIEAPEDGVFDTYSNVVNLNWTLYDVRIRFGELLQVPNDESPTWDNQRGILLERVAVTMPWQQAKYLRDILDGVIRNYEEINGELKPIKLPARPESLTQTG
jgi:hypothetical protein